MPKIIIYTTSNCPYCHSAKNLFRKLKIDFKEISLENDNELRQKLSRENNGWRTVPMIFINGNFVGGFDDVNKLHEADKLMDLLA